MKNTVDHLPTYQRAIAKGHFGSYGAKYQDLNKPIIAVVNTWNAIVPGHCHLRHIAEHVEKGIIVAGGYPLEFNREFGSRREGAIVKSSAIFSVLWVFSGSAKVFESEEECIESNGIKRLRYPEES